MSIYSIPPLITSLIFFSMAIAVIANNQKSTINLSYSLWAVLTVWWQGTWVFLFNVSDPSQAEILARIGYSGIIFLPISSYHFVIAFLRLNKTASVIFSYSIGALFLFANWHTNLFVEGCYRYSWGYYPKAGPLHPIYLIFLCSIVIHAIKLAYRGYQREKMPIRRNQLLFFFLGTLVYCFAAIDFLTNYGLNIYPLGFIPILLSAILYFYLVMFTFAFYHLRLMDLGMALRYSVRFLALAGIVAVPLALIGYMTKSWIWATGAGILFSFASPLIYRVSNSRRKHKLGNLDSSVQHSKTVDEFAFSLVHNLQDIFVPESIAILVWDESAERYTFRAGIGNQTAASIKSIKGDSPLLRELKTLRAPLIGETFCCNGDNEILNELRPFSAFITIPLYCNGDLMGIVHVGPKKGSNIYNDVDLQRMNEWITYAEQIFARICHSQLQETACKDTLTGCYNRRKIMDHLSKAIVNAKERNESLSVILADIDYFKRINDSYGHQSGDLVIKAFADLILGCVGTSERPNKIGITGRLGGEEFLVVLPQTNLNQALHIAERMMREVRCCSVTGASGEKINFTVSLGVSEFPKDGLRGVDLIQVADEMMYKAKAGGRNRIALSTSEVICA